MQIALNLDVSTKRGSWDAMTLEDVSAVRTYAERVLSSPRSAARYIER